MAQLPPELTPGVAAPTAPQLLASDQRRDQSVGLLSAACADGRLGLEDFSKRVDQALVARTVAELGQLEAGLGPTPASAFSASASIPMSTAWFVAIMSSTVRRGRWLLRPSSRALAVMGKVILDLRGAEVAGSHSHITAVAVMGSVTVIVPEGIDVELDGLAVMGNKSLRGGAEQARPGAPTVMVTAVAMMGEVTVLTKGPKPSKLAGGQAPAEIEWGDSPQLRQYIRHQRHHRDEDAL